jgi:hypothetical protein
MMDLTREIEDYGVLRQKQGQAEGPGDWSREPYDLRCDADALLKEIIKKVKVMSEAPNG